jgi:flagellar biosynthesis/type III secretory pathway M-ring protein FliF/YscJ
MPMLIFYAWVVFLLAIILSVPIVYLIESSRAKKARAAAEPEAAPAEEFEGEPVMEEVSEETPEDLSEFGSGTPVGEDDFSAFEEEFK